MSVKISPSVLTADFLTLKDDIKKLEDAGTDMLHLDVMDGIFVPNITFGPKMVKDIRKVTDLTLDVHLMITEPIRYIPQFAAAGADYITVHVEATEKVIETLSLIKEYGCKCGVVISPETPADAVRPYIKECDLVLVMSVHPGFGGQKFIPSALDKLRQIKEMRDELNPKCIIEIDGGITSQNVNEAKMAGAEAIVAGSAIFGSAKPEATIEEMRK